MTIGKYELTAFFIGFVSSMVLLSAMGHAFAYLEATAERRYLEKIMSEAEATK